MLGRGLGLAIGFRRLVDPSSGTCSSRCFLCSPCGTPLLVTPVPVTVRVAGSTTFAAALHDLAAAYQTLHPNVLIDMRQSGCEAGVRALVQRRGRIWPSSPGSPRMLRCRQASSSSPVARDAVALIVHPTNTMRGLTLLQAKSLYQGEVQDWQALGGPALEPIVVSREDGSGTRGAFEALVMGNERVTLNALIMPSTQAVVDYVAAHPARWLRVRRRRGRSRPGPEVSKTFCHHRPACRTARTLWRGIIYVYRLATVPPAARAFADFMLTPAGQAIIARHHVPLR